MREPSDLSEARSLVSLEMVGFQRACDAQSRLQECGESHHWTCPHGEMKWGQVNTMGRNWPLAPSDLSG